MPIVGAEPIESNIYRISLNIGYGQIQNVVVSPDGLYNIFYIRDGICSNRTGKILNVVQNRACPKNSYLLFDWSSDTQNHRERINFYRVTSITDVTPNDAYKIALAHGFVGTVDDWLASLKGEPGYSAFELAQMAGFEGNESEWLESLRGPQGLSAYEVAIKGGYEGTEEAWLASLKGDKGDTGESAYEVAIRHGFTGTEEDWMAANGDVTAIKQQIDGVSDRVETVEEHTEWHYEV
jgi:hypothetical protein